MVLSDGSEKAIGGVNLGVAGFGFTIALSVFALFLDNRTKQLNPTNL